MYKTAFKALVIFALLKLASSNENDRGSAIGKIKDFLTNPSIDKADRGVLLTLLSLLVMKNMK